MKATYQSTLFLLSLCLTTLLSLHAQQSQTRTPVKDGLIGYWKLSDDLKDHSGNSNHSTVHGPLTPNAVFNGENTWLEVPARSARIPVTDDFSISAWVRTPASLKDIPGDIISQYDPVSRRGFHFGLQSYASITSQGSYRQLSFGIDNNYDTPWKDYGRPGEALLAFGMAEYKGELYAGTCEAGPDQQGHVYRYTGDTSWVDCGSPDKSNSVIALAVWNGDLYAGTGHYKIAGSSLPESENLTPGGRVFRYAGGEKWIDCGQVPGVETIGGMVVFNGKLYASSMYRPAALYRYDGGTTWVACPIPDGKRVVNLAVYNGYLYATSWDVGNVYRYDGESWTDCGPVGDNTQNYAFAIYTGNLYVATWPSGRVYRFDGVQQWTDVGRLGNELEVMGMAVHNGRLIAGTLPLAEVYSYEGDTTWVRMDQLDKTPDVKYRRAWAMAEHAGTLFCSTLPSGRIYGYQAGTSVSAPPELGPGWQHIAAVKTADKLKLYINGKQVNEADIPHQLRFQAPSDTPLKIGFGPNDYFNGEIRELRLYNRALKNGEIGELSVVRKPPLRR